MTGEIIGHLIILFVLSCSHGIYESVRKEGILEKLSVLGCAFFAFAFAIDLIAMGGLQEGRYLLMLGYYILYCTLAMIVWFIANFVIVISEAKKT